MSNSNVVVEKVKKVQKTDKLSNSKKRQKKSATSEVSKSIIENGSNTTNSDSNKVKKLKSKKVEENLAITDLLTSVPQLGYKELGGGEGLGNGVIINKKKIFIPRQRKIQIYYTLTQTLITTLTPTFTTDSTSILKISLSPQAKTLYCLTSDGRLHYWSLKNFENYEGYLSFDKTVLDFQLTKINLNDDDNYKINLLVRDDSYDDSILSGLKFKSSELEAKWKNYWVNSLNSGEFATYVVCYDKSQSDKVIEEEDIKVGTSNTLEHFNFKEGSINDAAFLQTIIKKTKNWQLSGIIRIPSNCIIFNELRGYPNVLFTFVDNIIVLVDIKKFACTTYKHSRPITIIAIHPTLQQFAYGDNWGKILLNQFSVEGEELKIMNPNCTLHWHSQGVTSLCYLSSGIHLLSGGKESVMVQWNLVEGKTRLLPRLPQAIQTIYPYGNKAAAIRCEDGSVTVVHDAPDFKELTLFKGIDVPSEASPITAFDPLTNELAMISQNDKILFIQPSNGEISKSLETSQLNKFQQTNNKQIIQDPRITQVKFSKNGEWLITSEYWDPIGFPSQSSLKFWYFDSTTNAHTLVTHIIEPHMGQILNLQVFEHSTHGLIAITLGEDNFIRTWTLSNAEGENDEEAKPQWKCQISHEHPDSNKLIHFDVSSDGTLCALTSSSKIVLWDPITNNTLTYLAPSLMSPQMQKAKFIPNTPFLLIQSANHLTLVNLINKSQTWKLDLKPQQILIDETYNLIYCISPNTKETIRLIILDPYNCEALGFCQIPINGGEGSNNLPNLVQDPKNYLILKGGKKCSNLYWINGNRTLFGLNQLKSQLPKAASITQNLPQNELEGAQEFEISQIKKTNASSSTNKRTSSGELKSYIPDLSPIFEILKAPSHMLPNLKTLFSSLVNTVLPPKQVGNFDDEEFDINSAVNNGGEAQEDGPLINDNEDKVLLNGDKATATNKPFIQTYKSIDTSLTSVTPTELEFNQFLQKS